MAERILEETHHGKLDLIALGSGDGKQEVRLVQDLLDKEWLSGPIYRYCDDVKHVDIEFALDTQCPVPGSYSNPFR